MLLKHRWLSPNPKVSDSVHLSEAKDLHFFHKFPDDTDTVGLGIRTL